MLRRTITLSVLLHVSHALLLAPRAAAAAAATARGGTPRCSALRGLTMLDAEETAKRVQRCLTAKDASGLSFDELADQLGLTNTYTCQLLLGQAQLAPNTAPKLRALVCQREPRTSRQGPRRQVCYSHVRPCLDSCRRCATTT
mgnify:CR=1 FL=1